MRESGLKLYQITFSPTGGTKKVSDSLAAAMGKSSGVVDLTDRMVQFETVSIAPEDLVLIAVPSYGGRVPVTAVERILRLRGNGAAAVLICVYGNRAYEDTLVELSDAVCQAGFCPIAAVAAIAEHSVVRRFAAGRPDAEDKAALKGFAERILEKYRGATRTRPVIPGSRPYKKRGGSGMIPMPTENCVGCGICAARCPVGAIDSEDPEQVDRARCISCMRCAAICPHSARTVDETTLHAVETMLQKVCAGRRENELFL